MHISPKLTASEVHVWQIQLDPREAHTNSWRLLSPNELQRADRFYFERDRRRFIVGRTSLRKILAGYVGIAPQELIFSYGAKGKPALLPALNHADINFNFSHSGDLGLLAVTQGLLVGVDIERLDYELCYKEIAKRFFSLAEITTLSAVSPKKRAEAFFNCWTRKEAYIKATGEGVSLQLDSFDVAFMPGTPPALLRAGGLAHETSRWAMYDIHVPQGYSAALVVEGQNHQIRQRQWNLGF